MTKTTITPLKAPPPDDPVAAALAAPKLYEELFKHACVLLQRRLANRSAQQRLEATRDAVQEALTRALAKRGEFDPGMGTIGAWTHRILDNVCHETARQLRKMPAQALEDPALWEMLATDKARKPPSRSESKGRLRT